jgi:hypothetical protein
MLTKDQKKQLYLLMDELPKYLKDGTEADKLSYLADLVRAPEEMQEELYQQIFIDQDWPREYKHPSVFIKRVFDHM